MVAGVLHCWEVSPAWQCAKRYRGGGTHQLHGARDEAMRVEDLQRRRLLRVRLGDVVQRQAGIVHDLDVLRTTVTRMYA